MKRLVNWPDAILDGVLKSSVHFRTLHTIRPGRAIVVCTERLPDGTYRAGFAFCSPSEPSFDRCYGQKIAAHRMVTAPPRPGGYYFAIDPAKDERVGKKLRELALVEAHRLCVRWMDGVQEGDLR